MGVFRQGLEVALHLSKGFDHPVVSPGELPHPVFGKGLSDGTEVSQGDLPDRVQKGSQRNEQGTAKPEGESKGHERASQEGRDSEPPGELADRQPVVVVRNP